MPDQVPEDFDRNVFLNCPFDTEYLTLLRPLLFTLVYLGYRPRIALERSDSGEQRIDKICELIQEARYSIHDLSRLRAQTSNEFYRMNMPFELGIEYGCRQFGTNHLSQKKCLILAQGRYDYMKALSDLSGVDIKNHEDDPVKVVRCIRNWFVETARRKGLPGASSIWYQFNAFTTDFYKRRQDEGFSNDDLDMMPVPEYIDFIQAWLDAQRPAGPA